MSSSREADVTRDPGIEASPAPGANPVVEAEALATIYRFVLDCRAGRKGATVGAGEVVMANDEPWANAPKG
jgi:hypothetical protein